MFTLFMRQYSGFNFSSYVKKLKIQSSCLSPLNQCHRIPGPCAITSTQFLRVCLQISYLIQYVCMLKVITFSYLLLLPLPSSLSPFSISLLIKAYRHKNRSIKFILTEEKCIIGKQKLKFLFQYSGYKNNEVKCRTVPPLCNSIYSMPCLVGKRKIGATIFQ